MDLGTISHKWIISWSQQHASQSKSANLFHNWNIASASLCIVQHLGLFCPTTIVFCTHISFSVLEKFSRISLIFFLVCSFFMSIIILIPFSLSSPPCSIKIIPNTYIASRCPESAALLKHSMPEFISVFPKYCT